jgi:putative transposase
MRENLTYGLTRGRWRSIYGPFSEAPFNRKRRETDRAALRIRRHCSTLQMLNVMDAVSKKEQVRVKGHLSAMMYAETRSEALQERKRFEQAFRHNPKAVKTVVENWERLTTYYDFPREHWKHLRTSNVVESPFSRVRLRTAASRRFKSQVNATCLIWKTMMIAEMSFRKLNAPHLVEKVADGSTYKDGTEVKKVRVAA